MNVGKDEEKRVVTRETFHITLNREEVEDLVYALTNYLSLRKKAFSAAPIMMIARLKQKLVAVAKT